MIAPRLPVCWQVAYGLIGRQQHVVCTSSPSPIMGAPLYQAHSSINKGAFYRSPVPSVALLSGANPYRRTPTCSSKAAPRSLPLHAAGTRAADMTSGCTPVHDHLSMRRRSYCELGLCCNMCRRILTGAATVPKKTDWPSCWCQLQASVLTAQMQSMHSTGRRGYHPLLLPNIHLAYSLDCKPGTSQQCSSISGAVIRNPSKQYVLWYAQLVFVAIREAAITVWDTLPLIS